MTEKVMKLIDPKTNEMECRVCEHWRIAKKQNGRFERESWQCPNECELPKK